MTLVSTVTVGAGGAASIDFTSIPQTGTDLLVVFSLRSVQSNDTVRMNINGTISNITLRQLMGSGSAASSNSNTYAYVSDIPGTAMTANTFSSTQVYIPNYASTTATKSFSSDSVYENNATAATQQLVALSWNSTAAINRLTLTSDNGFNLAQYSTASLYTILATGGSGATVS